METKIKIFETGTTDGIMSKNPKFYPENYTEDQIKEEFLTTRLNIGKKFRFNGKKILQALQKTDTNKLDYPDGTYHLITDEDINNDDLWYVEIPADILIIEEKHKNIVVGNQMADCPILIVEDRKQGITALSHCGAPYINRELPFQTAEALIKNFNSEADNLYVYIGSNSKKESYIYDKYPAWATNNKVWDNNITNNNGKYTIDMESAIIRQLNELNINNITISPYDTVTSPLYYSHSAFVKGDIDKKGQNFVGFFYK